MTYDNWKTTEPDPGDYEPFGECHWCGYRAQLYRMWLLTGVEGWFEIVPLDVEIGEAALLALSR